MADSSGPDADGYYSHTVKAPGGRNCGALLIGELSKDSSLGLREVSRREPGLEEIFMAATRRSWDETRELSLHKMDSGDGSRADAGEEEDSI